MRHLPPVAEQKLDLTVQDVEHLVGTIVQVRRRGRTGTRRPPKNPTNDTVR